jgi:S-adenosylmethionine hydrolase
MTSGTRQFSPSGVVTLTTDFGLKDPFVGVMKGQVLARYRDASIVDLTHEVLAHWPAEAGFWLSRSFRYFPVGTVHVAVVDPGVGSERDFAIVEAEGHVFLAPDNGLLAAVVDAADAPVLRRVSADSRRRLGLDTPSATFHGRDVFAPLAAELASGREQPAGLGPPVDELIPGWIEDPVVVPGQVTGTVVTVDRFGNTLYSAAAR